MNIIEWEYDSDGDLGEALGRKQRAHEEDKESVGVGRGDDTFARGNVVVQQSSGKRRSIEEDDDSNDEEEEEEEEEEERTWQQAGRVTAWRVTMRVKRKKMRT